MRLYQIVFALFILTPLIEIFLFIEIGSAIGALPTILLIIVTAVVGVALLRQQGLSTLHNVQSQMQQGQVPAVEMLGGLMLFFAGALLLTPGFFTDTVGFLILIPFVRKSLALWFLERSGTIVKMNIHTSTTNQNSENFIEGEFKRKDD